LSDSIAGLTFAVVNVPQAMAHALLATVNPIMGIYTLMVAVPIGAIFTSSVYMNVSSTAALSVAAGARDLLQCPCYGRSRARRDGQPLLTQ
jgi:SulP family sulfate permease